MEKPEPGIMIEAMHDGHRVKMTANGKTYAGSITVRADSLFGAQ